MFARLNSQRRGSIASHLGRGTEARNRANRSRLGRWLRMEPLEERTLLDAASFVPVTGLPGSVNGAVAWGDIDNDGKLDVVIAGAAQFGSSAKGSTLIFHNNGDGTFEKLSVSLPSMKSAAVVLADFDNDGRVDLLLSGLSGSTPTTSLYHNDGDNKFTAVTTTLPGLQDSAIACADYNLDGYLDILLAGTNSSGTIVTQLYTNLGSNTFSKSSATFTGVKAGSLAWGDYDSDTRPDLVLIGTTSSGTAVTALYNNMIDGTFTVVADSDLPKVQHGSVAWADYDLDDSPDLLFTGEIDGTVGTEIYHNNGNETFSNTVSLTGVKNGVGVWGDYDRDGLLDVLVTGESSSGVEAFLFHNDGDDDFSDTDAGLTGVTNATASFTDFNGDGLLDIFLTGKLQSNGSSTEYSGLLWKNETDAEPATYIEAPTSLMVKAASPTTAFLLWDAPVGTDGTTALAGLTYSVRVGTTPGGYDIVSPMATSDGVRLVSLPGSLNAQGAVLTGLAVGQVYYCSVQAIDGTLNSSAFTDELSFALSEITLTVPSSVKTLTPEVTVAVSNAATQVADGLAAIIDVDLNGDGDFEDTVTIDGVEVEETDFARGALTNGTATFALPTLGEDGAYNIRARVDRTDVDKEAIEGQEGVVGVSATKSMSVDTTNPTVVVSVSPTQANPTAAWPIYYRVTFNKAVVDFNASDITVGGTASGSFVSAVTALNSTTYLVEVTGMTSNGKVTISIAADKVHDAAGNGNKASTGSATVTYKAPTPTFYLTGPVYNTYQSGDIVTIDWRAKDVGYASKISLCYDTDTLWNGNEKWIEIDQVAAANGTASYSWNTQGIKPGTYYIAGYLWSGSQPTFSHLTRTITIQGNSPTFALTAPTSGTYSAGNNVSIQWAASNVGSGSKISLCYDTDTLWNGNEKWIEIDKVAAANGKGSYTWNTSGVAAGSYYVGGYLWSNGQPVFSWLNSRITITANSSVPKFALTSPQNTSVSAGTSVAINWTASNYAAGSVVSLCYDTDTLWNGNEKWIEIDKASAASGTYNWDTTNVLAGKYYVAGYLWSNSTATYSRLTGPITVNVTSATLSFTGPTAGQYAAGQELLIQWAAGSYYSGSKVSLYYDTDTVLNGNEHWIEIDQAAAGDGEGGWFWKTQGLAAGTYYIGGYIYSQGKPTFARLANPITLQTTQTTFAFGHLLNTTSVTQGTLVSLAWNAGNVASGSTVGICLDSDSLWNGNETWIVNDTISAGNGLGGRDLDTSTLTPGTYYLGARLKSNGVYYYSHMTTTLTITASSSSGTSASVASLSSAALLGTSSWLDDDAADQLANSLLASNSSSATAKALASLI